MPRLPEEVRSQRTSGTLAMLAFAHVLSMDPVSRAPEHLCSPLMMMNP